MVSGRDEHGTAGQEQRHAQPGHDQGGTEGRPGPGLPGAHEPDGHDHDGHQQHTSGVPILQSLDIVGETSGNVVLVKASRDIQESVRKGESLSGPLANHWIFPPMVVQMLAVGEDTGALDTMLHKISDFYDQEVEATTEALTSLIEPLMIAVLGSVIGAMIVALYMPIFKVFDLIK